ncbi:MAG TPA: gas vesicle protein GvpG [Mycobacteriales bacterium]|nr:gas vesicle protein GvpG [Mycobacteriales bacterium]
MGLLSGLLMLPLLPARGVGWVAAQAASLAEDEWYDTGRIRAELRAAAEALDEGHITEEEFDRVEDLLLDELHRAEHRTTRH